MDEEKILDAIDGMEDEIVRFARELIQIPSEVPPGNYEPIINYYTNKLKQWGIEQRVLEKPGLARRKPNVLATLPGMDGKRTLIFSCHLDTVPGGDGWEPFSATIRDGKIFGRGAMDSKGAVAAFTMAAKALKDCGIQMRGNLEVLTFTDDEIGGEDTWHYIIENQLVKGDYIVSEGGGQAIITRTSSSVMVLEIIVYGRMTHAQTAHTRSRGINAIWKMNKVLNALDRYNQEYEAKTSRIPGLERCYMNLALVNGGIPGIWNVFPDKCSVQIEFRIVPEYSPDDVVAEIKDVIRQLQDQDPDLTADVRELWRVPGYSVPENLPLIQKLQSAIARVAGKRVPVGGINGFLPLGHFQKIGVTGVSWNPGPWEECNLHQKDEFLKIKDLIDGTKIAALTAMDVLQ
ncbi:MAG: M20 family metallopeptidase [Candidatus Bathyarchaeia archaeon]